MLNPVQKKRYQKRFLAIEASFRIEGMDPSGDAIYQSAKARVLTGAMTPQQALAYVTEQSMSHRHRVVATA